MTEQEAEIKRVISYIRSCREAGIDTTITIDKNRSHFILNALEEIQQCRALGTVEELREAMEKQIPMEHHHTRVRRVNRKLRESVCPNCLLVICTDEQSYPKFCNWCGQALDWS